MTLEGNIEALAATSGTWNGSFNFNIALEGAVQLISFTIDGTSYQAEKDMTWAQWVESEYNTVSAEWEGELLNINGSYVLEYEANHAKAESRREIGGSFTSPQLFLSRPSGL